MRPQMRVWEETGNVASNFRGVAMRTDRPPETSATPAGRSGQWKPFDRLSSDFYSALAAATLPTIELLVSEHIAAAASERI